MTGEEYADGPLRALEDKITGGIRLELVLGLVTTTALLYTMHGMGPDWIWTGCMDPGPNVAGCASVFPIGIFVPVFGGAVVTVVAATFRGKKDD